LHIKPKAGDQPVSWEWELSFLHDDGEVVVATWDIATSAYDLTWNIPNFTLPTNYNWDFDRYDGKIAGKVKVVSIPSYKKHWYDGSLWFR